MPVSSVLLSNNQMSYFVARLGNARLAGVRLGFAPNRAVDIDVDQTGRYLWLQTAGQQILDPSTTWTTTES